MAIFSKDPDDEATGGGTGDGGTTGTPGGPAGPMAPPGHPQDENMVVSGGEVARPGDDDANAAGDRGLG